MSVNLLEIVKKELSGELAGKIASLLGENSTTVGNSIGPAVASIIAGMINKASTSGGGRDLVAKIDAGGFNGDFLNRFGSMLTEEKANENLQKSGNEILSSLFGNKQGALGKVLALATGLSKGSLPSLLGMIAPFVMGVIGKQAGAENLDSRGLTNLLNDQIPSVQRHAPAALAPVLGLANMSLLGTGAASGPAAIFGDILGFIKEFWPFLVGILAIGLIMKTCSHQPAKETPPPPVEKVAPPVEQPAPDTTQAAPAAPDSLGAFSEFKLPNGVALNIPEFGIERKLIAFIEDKTKPVDKTTWFTFDRLVFDTGKATLKPKSQEQIKNINEILNAYPAVELKFGGYTDNVGNEQFNQKLSQDRAETVMNEVAALGIDKARLAAEGYGSQHPVADNATEEGRRKNRRVDCRVTKK